MVTGRRFWLPRRSVFWKRAFERTLIRTAMSATRGRRIEAAERLGLGRNTLTRKIAELGLTDELASRLPPVRKKDQVKSLDDGAA